MTIMTPDEVVFRTVLAACERRIDASWTDIAVAAHLGVLQERRERLHAKFGFVPHPDNPKKCACAYCARDFEAVSAMLMELEQWVAGHGSISPRLQMSANYSPASN